MLLVYLLHTLLLASTANPKWLLWFHYETGICVDCVLAVKYFFNQKIFVKVGYVGGTEELPKNALGFPILYIKYLKLIIHIITNY